MPDTQPNSKRPIADPRVVAAWRNRADWLAHWTLSHMVNRIDLWGCYRSQSRIKPDEDGKMRFTRLAPRRDLRGERTLGKKALLRHFTGEDSGHLIGLFSTSAQNQSRWFAFDVHHDPGRGTTPEKNRVAAMHLLEDLSSRGFRPLLIDSNGVGGFHLLVILKEPLPTPRVHAFASELVSDPSRLGLEVAPAVFPSQPSLSDPNSPGDWFRLPGRHPMFSHYWSRVWHLRRWQEGVDAVEVILGAHGNDTRLVPEIRHVTYVGNDATAPAPPSNLTASLIMPEPAKQSACDEDPELRAAVAIAALSRRNDTTHDDLEKQVLGHLLGAASDGRFADEFAKVGEAGISPPAFGVRVHRTIFTAMQGLHSSGRTVDAARLAEITPPDARGEVVGAMAHMMAAPNLDSGDFAENLAKMPKTAVVESPADCDDPDLRRVIRAWPKLSAAMRQGILAMIQASAPDA